MTGGSTPHGHEDPAMQWGGKLETDAFPSLDAGETRDCYFKDRATRVKVGRIGCFMFDVLFS